MDSSVRRHTRRRSKCLICKSMFVSDPRNVGRQKVCSTSQCQRARKRLSHQAWLAKPENRNYFRGPSNVARVQQWRKCHPGYWRRNPRAKAADALQEPLTSQPPEDKQLKASLDSTALQDALFTQHPVIVGLISKLTGDTLQEDIARAVRTLIDQGSAILGPSRASMATKSLNISNHDDNKTTHCSPARATTARALELDRPPPGA